MNIPFVETDVTPLNPSPHLLCKLGSILVHVEEGMSPTGHVFDVVTLRALLDDPDVKEWMKAMDGLALLPVKRRP